MTGALLDHLHTITGDASAVNDYHRQQAAREQNNRNQPQTRSK